MARKVPVPKTGGTPPTPGKIRGPRGSVGNAPKPRKTPVPKTGKAPRFPR